MEPSEETVQINKDNFLEVPSLSDSLSEDEQIKDNFKPHFSPLPRRRGSDSSESDYPYLDTPTSGSRRVSFADALGFNLVSIKEYDCWELPGASSHFDLMDNVFHTEEYVLSPLFDLPSKEVLMQELQVQKAMLESTEFLPGATTMKGTIRVLNVSFEKLVYVRMSLDNWLSHYDILAEYVPNSCDGETDQFSFKISLVPPYQKDGARIEFCIRYETSIGTFWSNNNGENYILVCQKKEREKEPEKSPEVITNRLLRGCLKVKSSKEENDCNNSRTTDTSLPTIICSYEDKEDTETSGQNVKDANREYDVHNEKEIELMLNQHSIRTRSSSTRDESSFAAEPANFPNTVEEFENQRTFGDPDQGKEEGIKKIEVKEGECPTRESLAYIPAHMNASKECSVPEKKSSRKGYEVGKEKEEQRIKFGISERQNEDVLSISTDHQGKRGHPEIGVNMSQVSHRSPHDHHSKINEISVSSYIDRSHSVRADLAGPKDVCTTQRDGLVNSEGTTPERMHGQVCSPGNGNNLQTNLYLPQVQKEKSDRDIPEDQKKTACGNQSWNVLESQVVLRKSKTNRTEQIKEQADGEDMWEIRDNTRNLNVTPTEELFTCQETVICELSSVADHGITEKAEAGTAYIIKTTSESTLESMSAREKAIIAKLPQETSLSDRPTEEKETAFDPHEGRNDDSHYPLCHRDSVDVIYDIDFEKKSHLGIYNVHIDETRKEETMSQCNSGEILDRAESGIRNIASVGESLQATPENGKASSELNFYSVQLPTIPNILKKSIDHAEVQGLPQKNTDLVALAHQSFNSERSICPQNGTQVSTCPNKTQSNEEALATECPMADTPFKSISSFSECKCDPHSEVQCIDKNTVPEECNKSSIILTSGGERERVIAESLQQAENNMEKSLGPMILISEPTEDVEETNSVELINDGQEFVSPGFKPGNRADSSNFPAQDNQTLTSESLLSKYINSKITYFLLLILFLLTTYYYDLMIGLAFYLFSLYWLSWEGGRPQEPVKKK
ncbi:protein phosphatase 1 regulatory subunit 3A isoform X2 [Macrotis lagotis]|uniref:protein phosphatase 1 regulatory subunit 3A isoform X2 n=1 Tax=Macrotis lagotis TaxID=92651 RepID=UPI003D69D624